MKRVNLFMLLAAATLAAACSSDEMEQNESRNAALAVQFSAGNLAAVQTRTTINGTTGETQWSENDPVGLFMTGAATANNMKYTVSNATTGTLAPDGAANTLYYPPSGDYVDFLAYYPWKNGQTPDKYAMDVSDQSNPSAIDLLYSDKATGYNKTSATVGLTFYHASARLKMKILAGEGFDDLTGLTAVTIRNVSTTANFNLSEGSISDANSGQHILARNTNANDDVLRELILIPAQYPSGKVVFTVSGVDYFWDISAIDFRSGELYSYEITVSKTGITTTGATWESGNSYNDIIGTFHIQDAFADAEGEGTVVDPKQVTFPSVAWNDDLKKALESELADCYADLDLSDLTGIEIWEQNDVTLNRSVQNKIVHLLLPNSVTTIGGSSLRTSSYYGAHYTNLQTVSGEGVTTIETDAFNGQHEQSSLTAVYFPKVTQIENYVFISCTKLETVYLPSLQSAGGYNFVDTGTQPLRIVLGTAPPTFGDYSFINLYGVVGAKPVTVQVPAGSIDSYDATWQNQLKNGNGTLNLTISISD
ncbi:MAG: fimbrillin family protein [Tannerellaceae bacterium]|nr:fimbrillin family protein [Tannerellaceae bacterium]